MLSPRQIITSQLPADADVRVYPPFPAGDLWFYPVAWFHLGCVNSGVAWITPDGSALLELEVADLLSVAGKVA